MSLHLISYFSYINPSQHTRIIFAKHKSYCDVSWFKSLLVAQQCTQSKHEPIIFTKYQTLNHVPILLLLSYPNPQSTLLKPNLCFLRTNHSKEHYTSKLVFLNLTVLSLWTSPPSIPSEPATMCHLSHKTYPSLKSQYSWCGACSSVYPLHFVHNYQVIVRNSRASLSPLPNLQLLNMVSL